MGNTLKSNIKRLVFKNKKKINAELLHNIMWSAPNFWRETVAAALFDRVYGYRRFRGNVEKKKQTIILYMTYTRINIGKVEILHFINT